MVVSTLTGFDRILLADIGGTNARFALLNRGEIGPISRIKVAEHRDLIEAIAAFLTSHMVGGEIGAAVLGVAGTVENNSCRVTNSGWMVGGGVLQAAFGFKAVRLLNDFEALAWSLPQLKPADLYPIGGGRSVAGAPMLVIGPGTGFGAACLVLRDGSAVAIAAEAGHATLPGTSQRDDAVIDHLRSQFGHVSAERALSGPGWKIFTRHSRPSTALTFLAATQLQSPRRRWTAVVASAGQHSICFVLCLAPSPEILP